MILHLTCSSLIIKIRTIFQEERERYFLGLYSGKIVIYYKPDNDQMEEYKVEMKTYIIPVNNA